MSDKEQAVIEKTVDAINDLNKEEKFYILGYVEGLRVAAVKSDQKGE